MTFKNKINKNKFLTYIYYYLLPYLGAFLVLQFIVFFTFRLSDKSFVWNIDGIHQHYPSLKYYGEFLRNLFSGNGVPLVDFNIGMGFDTLTTLNYYAIGDPLTLITIFSNTTNMEKIYEFLILLRFCLAGVSFTLYCYYMKKKGFQSVLGGLIYIFCGYALYAGVRHPYFTNPMIYLPLLFIGLEKILNKKKPYLFIVMIFISAMSNFYFFYMLTILIFIYAVIRFFSLYKKEEHKSIFLEFFKTAMRAGLYYCLGVLLASFIFIPVVVAFLNNGRFDTGYDVNLLHYAVEYYVLMVNQFLAADVTCGYWTQLTYAGITPIGILIIFKSKKYRQLQIAFCLGTIFLMIPAIGYIMNGFAYVSNRWEFGYSFLVAFIFVVAYEEMFSLKTQDKILLIAGITLYAILGLGKPNKSVWIALIFLCISVLAILYFNVYKKSAQIQRIYIFLILFFNIAVNGVIVYHPKFGNYVNEFIDSGKVQKTIENSALSLLPEIKDDSFYRIETYGDGIQNEALTLKYNDVSGYFSIMDKRVTEYFKGVELLSQVTAFRFNNLDYRTTLDTLANVKYVLTDDLKATPYAYKLLSKEKVDGKTYYLLENQYFLPLGYTYNKFITRDDYEKLSSLEKQEIMLQAIVLEEPIEPQTRVTANGMIINSSDILENFTAKELEAKLSPDKGIEIKDNKIRVLKKGAKLRIYFKGEKKSETYLRLENFNINNTNYSSIKLNAKGENEAKNKIDVRAINNNSYFGKTNYLVNVGYNKNAINYCDITFNNKGSFKVEDLQIYTLSMENHGKRVNELKQDSLEDVQIHNNVIKGSIDLETDKVLCFSIPYSKGWTAFVDGKETNLLQANVMYMGLPLNAGSHTIKLVYITPYLREGVFLSMIGFIVLISIIIYNYIRERKVNVVAS
jgi:uncharacterized membrane protein YfhO